MRLDWTKIKALSTDAGLLPEDSALFILPVSGRDLLMSIMERFEWEATFRVPGYDYSDWDFLQSIVSTTENGLMGTVLMDDITEQLDRIATALEVMQECCTIPILTDINQTISELQLTAVNNIELTGGGGGCGNTLETWRVPDGWEDDHPGNQVPDDDTPTEEATGDLCDMAHSAHAEIREWFQEFASNVSSESPYTDIVEYMNLFALVNKSTAWLYSAMTSVISLWYDDLLSDVDNFWMEIKEEFICAVLENDNAVALRAWVFERVRQNPPTWSAGMYMETLLTGTTFNIIYDGTYNILPEYLGSECDCLALSFPELPEGYFYFQALESEVSYSNIQEATTTYDEETGEFTHTATTSGNNHNVQVNHDMANMKSRVGASSVAGGVIVYTSGSVPYGGGADNFPTTNASNDPAFALDVRYARYNTNEYAGNGAFALAMQQFDNHASHSNAEPDGKWVNRSLGTPIGPWTARVWFIGKE